MTTHAIAENVARDMKSASWIREMFEKGRRLKAELGDDNVYDFSLGNPNASPPKEFFDALRALAAEPQPGLHRYMPNAGFDETRAAVAALLSRNYPAKFDAAGVIMTSGCAGAMNVTLHTICSPGDEVIVLAPYFPEYRFYAQQAAAKLVLVDTDEQFQPDPDKLRAAITPKTRAVIVCSPNNPTGVVYTQERLDRLCDVLRDVDRPDRPLYLLCDDVYHRLIFDLDRCPTPVGRYARAIVCASFSKDLSIAGERCGYVALPPDVPERGMLLAAMTMLNRTLGFVNAGALIQRAVARCADARCDIGFYQGNRDLLCNALHDYGYELTMPQGAMFAFPKSPLEDDVAFVEVLLQHQILAVPGRGFGRPGHMRISYCVDRKTIERALPGFCAAIEEVR